MRQIAKLILIVTLVVFPQSFQAAPTPEPNIGVNGYFASDRAQRGRIIQAAVVMEIPSGYHVNANRTLNKRSEEHTSELQSRLHLVCRLLLEKKKKTVRQTKHRATDQ